MSAITAVTDASTAGRERRPVTLLGSATCGQEPVASVGETRRRGVCCVGRRQRWTAVGPKTERSEGEPVRSVGRDGLARGVRDDARLRARRVRTSLGYVADVRERSSPVGVHAESRGTGGNDHGLS